MNSLPPYQFWKDLITVLAELWLWLHGRRFWCLPQGMKPQHGQPIASGVHWVFHSRRAKKN
jgi:hypothetical protein